MTPLRKILALVGCTLILSVPPSSGEDLCDGHGCKVKWEIQASEAIHVTVKGQAAGNPEKSIPPTLPYEPSTDLGYAYVSNVVSFEVSGYDRDDHVCQSVVKGKVLNYIEQNTELAVNVTNEDGASMGTVELVSDQPDVGVTDRIWKGTWPIPSEAAGKHLLFQFEGTVADVPCSSHGPSNDEPDADLSAYKAKVTVPKVESITVIPIGMSAGDALPEPVCIGAGAIASPAHQAKVEIQVLPKESGIPVEVSIEKGIGHVLSAKLVIGGATVYGGGPTAVVTTETDGKIQGGVLTSSDSLDTCAIHACEASNSVRFAWDEVEEKGEWWTDLDYLPVTGVLKNWLRLNHHRCAPEIEPSAPLNQHGIRMFVEKVEYWDEQGQLQTILNTRQSPSNLNAWAEFPDTPTKTGADGVVRIDLHLQNKANLYSVLMVAYDWSVWRKPGSSPTPLGAVKLQAQPGPPPEQPKNRDEASGERGKDEDKFKVEITDISGVGDKPDRMYQEKTGKTPPFAPNRMYVNNAGEPMAPEAAPAVVVVTAKVTPSDAVSKLHWSWYDPDEPAGAVPDDVDVTAGDNHGAAPEFGAHSTWSFNAGEISSVPDDKGIVKVQFKANTYGGDNFQVGVGVEAGTDNADRYAKRRTESKVLTVWKRIYLETPKFVKGLAVPADLLAGADARLQQVYVEREEAKVGKVQIAQSDPRLSEDGKYGPATSAQGYALAQDYDDDDSATCNLLFLHAESADKNFIDNDEKKAEQPYNPAFNYTYVAFDDTTDSVCPDKEDGTPGHYYPDVEHIVMLLFLDTMKVESVFLGADYEKKALLVLLHEIGHSLGLEPCQSGLASECIMKAPDLPYASGTKIIGECNHVNGFYWCNLCGPEVREKYIPRKQ